MSKTNPFLGYMRISTTHPTPSSLTYDQTRRGRAQANTPTTTPLTAIQRGHTGRRRSSRAGSCIRRRQTGQRPHVIELNHAQCSQLLHLNSSHLRIWCAGVLGWEVAYREWLRDGDQLGSPGRDRVEQAQLPGSAVSVREPHWPQLPVRLGINPGQSSPGLKAPARKLQRRLLCSQ